MNAIKDIVADIAAKFHAQIVDQFTISAKAAIAQWQKDSADKGMTDPWYLYPSKSTGSRWEYFSNQQKRADIAPYITMTEQSCMPKPKAHALKNNVEGIIAKKAKEYADFAVAGFIAKMNAKFEGICEAKGNVSSIRANGSLGWNAIRFEFADGSSFDAQNSIVSKWSSRGRPFNQYPTTFRNVILPGGERMKSPSEAKVKRAFVASLK